MKSSDILLSIFIALLLALPAGYEPNHFAKALFCGSFLQSLAYSFILILFFRRRAFLKRATFTLAYILFGLESFLFFYFGSRFDPNILTLILQTSGNEIKEFVSVYLITPSTLAFCTIFVLLYFITYHIIDRITIVKWEKYRAQSWLPKAVILLFIVIGLFIHYIPLPCPIGENSINRLATSIGFVVDRHAEIEKMKVAIDDIVITESPKEEEAPIIVLVIGESFNKYHSSLYGYYLPTSPSLEKELVSNNLTCYSNAISPTNGTDFAMRFIFTLKGCETNDSIGLRSFVPMPAVFKRANYKVAYFDNQYTRSLGGSLDYSCGYFLNPSYINDNCFDFRNNEIYKYDGDFIDRSCADLLKEPKSFNIIHLKGQHFDAALRFPDSFAVFKKENIKRADLNDKERQRVADYDNATLYNDYVLSKILNEFREKSAVIVYLSDHGEHIYDGGKQYYGRGFGTKHEEETIKAVYEVPFMIWCSDSFINKNPSTYQKIREAIKRPICTADLPYLLFDIAEIEFNHQDKTKSIINSEFKPHDVIF